VTDEIRTRMIALLPRLRRFAAVLTGNLDQADDLVQETCVRALSRVDQWQPGTRLDSWMYRIAQNLWLDRVRANRARGEIVAIDTVEAVMAGSDGRDVAESRLTLAAVNAALKKLSPDQQIVVALVCVEGASYKEAAAIMDIPIGTVMSRLARARRELHTILEPGVAAERALPEKKAASCR
jgi:RNA polymerase sigma-70 factor, ECF subfamily